MGCTLSSLDKISLFPCFLWQNIFSKNMQSIITARAYSWLFLPSIFSRGRNVAGRTGLPRPSCCVLFSHVVVIFLFSRRRIDWLRQVKRFPGRVVIIIQRAGVVILRQLRTARIFKFSAIYLMMWWVRTVVVHAVEHVICHALDFLSYFVSGFLVFLGMSVFGSAGKISAGMMSGHEWCSKNRSRVQEKWWCWK